MKLSARLLLAAVVLLALLAGLLIGGDGREKTSSTFGRVPNGYGAVFDLLTELGLPVRRSYAGAHQLPRQATVWWIEPFGLCGPEGERRPGRRKQLAHWSGEQWIRRGGTGVVFLPPARTPCASIAGQILPARPEAKTAAAAEEQDGGRRWWEPRLERWFPRGTKRTVEGPLTPRPRRIENDRPTIFSGAGDWTVAASADGKPFALEKQLGEGRLVVFAEARFLSNAWLDHLDAAPLALDVVRAYGTPLFDERSHGFLEHDSTLLYLLKSPAAAVFAALAVFGLLFAAHGALLPPRAVAEVDLAAPTLESFVDSLAVLYSRTRDHARVFERYRELTLGRLRRHFGLPVETPPHVVVERLHASRRADAEVIRLLSRTEPVRGEAQLRRAAARLDAAVWDAVRAA